MTKSHSSATLGLFVLLAASAGISCKSDTPSSTSKMIASSSGAMWTVYDNPYGNGMPNPITSTITGTATAWDVGGKMRLQLVVSGLPPNRAFGSHLHKLACDDATKAGGHYENNMWPDSSTASDPSYANPTNEAWLDFTADGTGKATPPPETIVDWIPRAGGAKAIIIHDMKTQTSPMGGVAGAKLACLPITGF
jgi:superoxide dismutase, Cu-Zn family